MNNSILDILTTVNIYKKNNRSPFKNMDAKRLSTSSTVIGFDGLADADLPEEEVEDDVNAADKTLATSDAIAHRTS